MWVIIAVVVGGALFVASRATQAMNTNRTAGDKPVITSNTAGGASTDLTSAAIAEAALDSPIEATGGTPVSTHVPIGQFIPLNLDDTEKVAYAIAYGGGEDRSRLQYGGGGG